MTFPPNRIVALLTFLTGIAAAVFVAVADVDWSTRAGVIGGVGLAVVAANRWLIGWQAHEARSPGS